jgi:hypothetical protein
MSQYLCKQTLCLTRLIKIMAASTQFSESFLCILYTIMDTQYIRTSPIQFKALLYVYIVCGSINQVSFEYMIFKQRLNM